MGGPNTHRRVLFFTESCCGYFCESTNACVFPKMFWPSFGRKCHYLPLTKEEVGLYLFARTPAVVSLSVCLSLCARLLKNACMDSDEMLRVDRCRDMDELINFELDPDHSPDAATGFLPPISYRLRNFAALSSLAYFSANLSLTYFSAISVSICAKLACSILMRDRNTATEPNFRKSLSKCRILSPKTVTCPFRTSTSSNSAAVQLASIDQ